MGDLRFYKGHPKLLSVFKIKAAIKI